MLARSPGRSFVLSPSYCFQFCQFFVYSQSPPSRSSSFSGLSVILYFSPFLSLLVLIFSFADRGRSVSISSPSLHNPCTSTHSQNTHSFKHIKGNNNFKHTKSQCGIYTGNHQTRVIIQRRTIGMISTWHALFVREA